MTKSFKLIAYPAYMVFFTIVFTSLTLFHADPAAAAGKLASVIQQRQQIAQLTSELNPLLARYRQASPDSKDLLLAQLESLASERQQLLSDIVAQDPDGVLSYALPPRIQKQFPESVQSKFETWVSAEGKFETFYEDHEQAEKNRRLHFLNQDGQRFPLSFAKGKAPSLMSGSPVLVQGVMPDADNPVIALNEEQLMLAVGGSGDPVITSTPTILDNTIGEQRTAVFLINFQDNPSDQPWSVSQIEQRFFTEISQFFLENSYQQTWLTGDVLGWYTLPINSTDSCDQWGMADAADAIALANNVNLNQYDRYVYVFPNNTCSWSGFASVGGTQTRAWIKGVPFTKAPAHEMGHNFGLLHSHGLNCEGDATDTNCVSTTYGDQLDTMGAKPGHFNAYQKERLGWLNQNQTPPIVTVDQAGSYAIEAYENTSSNAKALKVYKDIDPDSGLNRWYYIEFRQPVGEDQFIATDPYLVESNISNGIIIRMGTEDDGNSSYLLDMTPESTSFSGNFADLYDPALVVGNSYTDSATGLTISTEYTDSQSATVYVGYNSAPQPCSHANPQLSVSPTQSQWVAAGSSVSFTVNVSNQDSSNCPSSVYNVSANLPSGWTADSKQLSLAPGASGSVDIAVSSDANTADGFYTISMVAENSDNAGYTNSADVTYVVSTPTGNTAPDAVNDSAVLPAVQPIVINVLSNDSDPDNDAIFISALGSAAKGDVSINADGTVLYTPAKRFKDSDSFSYTISDGLATATATVSLNLQSSSAGGDTGGGGKGGGKGGKPTK